MKQPVFFAYLGVVIATAAVAVAAGGVDTPPSPRLYLMMSGHPVGIGEQQVYAIDRSADLVVRYRDSAGMLHAKSYRHHALSSVAFTIEGLSSAGHPVLAMATANGAPQASQSPAGPAGPESPPPSPELDQRGALAVSGNAADLAPASVVLSGISEDFLTAGKPWKSSGQLSLPYARINVMLDSALASPTPAAADTQLSDNVVQIVSHGSSDVRGKLNVVGFGRATLRGAGTANGVAFADSQNKLLLGCSLTSQSHGNAAAQRKKGVYDLKLQVAIKLVRYVPGLPPPVSGPGYILASGHVGSYASPDTGVLSTAPPNAIAVPAATNTEYVGSPLPSLMPSALPEASLPPIPMPLASDQPVASPPPGPTPTPTPTRY